MIFSLKQATKFWSQRQLAKMAGKSQATIWKWLKSDRIIYIEIDLD